MNARMLYLDNTGFMPGATTQTVTATVPPDHNVVPPLPYVAYVVVDGIPSVGQFVSVT